MRIRVIDVGPFDNDPATEFGEELDDVEFDEMFALVRRALEAALAADPAAADTVDRVQPRAVAAIAVVAGYRQGGPPAGATDPPGFLQEADPDDLPDDLVPLALAALDAIVGSGTEWTVMLGDSGMLDGYRTDLTD